ETGLITFSGTVRNCGNTPLVGVVVSNLVNGVASLLLGPINLDTNQTMNFSGSYVPNSPCSPTTDTVFASGRDTLPTPSNVVATASATCANTFTPGITVTNLCPPNPPAPGQPITFSGSVNNTGNITLTNVVVVIDQPAPNTIVFTRSRLAPGESASF